MFAIPLFGNIGFTEVERTPVTLLDRAIQSLLSNESIAIRALDDLPRDLFVPLFTAAFIARHKKVVMAMVKVWPHYCLHVGAITIQEPQNDLLKAIINSLQLLPVQNSTSRVPKLRVLDLRLDTNCRTTCSVLRTRSSTCLYSCSYSECCIYKVAQRSPDDSELDNHVSRQPMELLVDLSLDGSLREREFMSLLIRKVEQSLGSLHLCCRDLQIDKLSTSKRSLRILDLKCIQNLAIDQASLTEVTNLLSPMVHLDSLSLFKVKFRSLTGKVFKIFLNQLENMSHLKEFNLSSFCLRDHLDKLLRVLPSTLDFLYLPFCALSYRDFIVLSQWPQTTKLKLLNLSNNPMYWEDYRPLQTLIKNLSGTIQHLEINHCRVTDSIMASIIPFLSDCLHLRVLGFAFNPITMPMLIRTLKHLTHLTELKFVCYPVPMHCFDQWNFEDSLDRQKLADVKAQLKMLLHTAQRDDMNLITYSE